MRTWFLLTALLGASCHHEPTAEELLAAGDAELAEESVPAARRAVALFQKAAALPAPPALQAKIHSKAADAYSLYDEPAAVRELEQAVAIAQAAGDAATALEHRITIAYLTAGDKRIDALGALLAEAKAGSDRRVEAYAGVNLGIAFFGVRRPAEAIAAYEAALPLARAASDPAIVYRAEEGLAESYYMAVDADHALLHIEPALEAARSAHLPLEEAQTLLQAGNIHFWSRRDATVALVYYTRVAIVFATHGMAESSDGIGAQMNLARARGKLGDTRGAVTDLERALAAARARTDVVANKSNDATVRDVLLTLGPAYADDGRTAEALATLAETAALARKADDDLRFVSAQANAARIVLREKRYRDALELVAPTGEAMARLDAKVAGEKLRFSQSLGARNVHEFELEARAGLGEWSEAFAVSEGLRARLLLATLGGTLVDSAAAQGLLDDDTVLVEYALTGKDAYAFVVDSRSTAGLRLGAAKDVTEAARRWYELAQTRGADLADASRVLADQILAPLADRLHGRRLVVVPDRALLYVAFAALPLPGGKPVVERFELVTLPSASVLAALRGRSDRRPRATHSLAVLADPIFDPGDARLGGPTPPPVMVATRAGENLVRLPATHDEAEAIAALVPPDQVFRVEGAEATPAAALGPEVASARFVHFATHALLDAVDPDKSALILTGGSVRVPDIEASHLAADLVVLSACKTAIGKRFDGEGMVGLTRAFVRAGVPRVVSSLLQVDDRATASLMARFYRGMLDGKLAPAAALRQAQLAARSTPPRLWAGFTFQGDWR